MLSGVAGRWRWSNLLPFRLRFWKLENCLKQVSRIVNSNISILSSLHSSKLHLNICIFNANIPHSSMLV